MYAAQSGDRILTGAERRLFTESLEMIADLLSVGDLEFGIEPFDNLQYNQKLVALYRSARAALRPDEPPPKRTAFLEAAIAVVYQHVQDMVCCEIDEPESWSGTSFRKMIVDAATELEEPPEFLPDETSTDLETWECLLDCLSEDFLWGRDFECPVNLDLPPEDTSRVKAVLGIEANYFTDVPPDPPDDQVALYLDAIKGLTCGGR